jgi:hypothetical protein
MIAAGGAGFCYVPRVAELSFQGEDGAPSFRYPLQECQGSCDDNSECDVRSY